MRREPQYEHDCDQCVYLSDYEDCDLYYCQGVEKTLVCRWGSDGPEYTSAPPELVSQWIGSHFPGHHPLVVGLRRAMELGLIETKTAPEGAA